MTGSMTMKRSVISTCFRLRRLKHRELSRRSLSQASQSSLPFSRQSSTLGTRRSSRSFWTLSFSGAGHLMPYHLGVAKTLLSVDQHKETNATSQLPIKSVSGSSSGAIAATVVAIMPHRLEEYTDRFLQDRGHAFRNLRQMMEEETSKNRTEQSGEGLSKRNDLLLSICTTRCTDGGIELFSFDNDSRDETTTKRLLTAIEASCRIPRSFHPFDMVALNYKGIMQSENDTYPEAEGIEIDGNAYVDGGIAAPFPPTPLDGDEACTGRIVVSPIAGEYFYKTSDDDCHLPLLKAIRPKPDNSPKAPFINSVPISGSGGHSYEVPMVAVRANPSLQNLRNMTAAMGVVPASPNDHGNGGGILNDWYKHGQEDAYEMLHEME